MILTAKTDYVKGRIYLNPTFLKYLNCKRENISVLFKKKIIIIIRERLRKLIKTVIIITSVSNQVKALFPRINTGMEVHCMARYKVFKLPNIWSSRSPFLTIVTIDETCIDRKRKK